MAETSSPESHRDRDQAPGKGYLAADPFRCSEAIAPVSNPSPNDIPSARRQPSEIPISEIESITFHPQKKRKKGLAAIALILIAGLTGAAIWQWEWLSPHLSPVKAALSKGRDYVTETATEIGSGSDSTDQTESARTAQDGSAVSAVTSETPDAPSSPSANGTEPDSTVPTLDPTQSATPAGTSEELLGHRRYDIADESSLVPLNSESIIRFKPDARDTILRMIEKARIEGVQLGVISGFRTLDDQHHLYFEVKAKRGQSARTRASVSAPPGYSEHHTGYAIDFIDPTRPETHLSESFETTRAYAWLVKNAPYFNLELSFPKDNDSGVQYEPWHWRFVGNQESLELFYRE